ncbi:hypothetical protein DEDE109153_07540 [Deinococcus deserti]
MCFLNLPELRTAIVWSEPKICAFRKPAGLSAQALADFMTQSALMVVKEAEE